MKRTITLGLAVLSCLAQAQADELAPPQVARQGALTVLTVEGRSEGEPGSLELELGPLRGRARRSAGGLVRGSLSTRRVLLPGRYTLVLREGAQERARREVELGSAEEQTRSREAEARWLLQAARGARELSRGLERTGRFLSALQLSEAERRTRTLGYLAGWRHQLRRARADLALFERRVVLAHRPDAIAALGRVQAALAARGRSWEAALERGVPLAEGLDPELEAAAAALRSAGELPELGSWDGGPLATPPAWERLQPGSPWRADGFELQVPAGWEVAGAPTRPELRLHLRPAGDPSVVLTVTVSEAPEASTLAALEALHETSNWESFPGYARPTLTRPGTGGLELRFDYDPAGARAPADAARAVVHVAQRVLFQPARGATWTLSISWAGERAPTGLDALLAGFRLTGGP